MSIKGLNATRLGESLLKLECVPLDVKESVARKMRSSAAKKFTAELDSKRRAQEVPDSSELLTKRKSAKIDGSAAAKEEVRRDTLSKFIARDAGMPKELFDVALYYMSVFFIMCRIPFVVAASVYFKRFLWSLRPSFVKLLPSQASLMPHCTTHT